MAGRNDESVEKYLNGANVSKALKNIPHNNELQELSETFKALSDPTRLKIICALMNTELCVSDIAQLLGASDSLVSHQLRILRNLRLVTFRKEGKTTFYALDDIHINHLVHECLLHVREP